MYPQHTDFSQPAPNPLRPTLSLPLQTVAEVLHLRVHYPVAKNTGCINQFHRCTTFAHRTPDVYNITSTTIPYKDTIHLTKPTQTTYPFKKHTDQSSQSSIAREDEQHVPKSADGARVKCSRQQPRQPDEHLCFHCNLPGHLKRNCPEIPYCSKCRTKGHAPDRCVNKPQKTRHTHPAGKPRDQRKKKNNLPQFSSHHNKCLQCAGDHQTANCT